MEPQLPVQTPSAQTPAIAHANVPVSPQAISAAVGPDPFSQIMSSAQTVVQRPAPPADVPATPPAVEPAANLAPHSPVKKPEDLVDPKELVREALGEKKELSLEENLKALRKTQKELLKEKEAREEQLRIAAERLKKYEAGEEVPEPIKERERGLKAQIEKLKPYEQLHALKFSDEYEEKFVRPLDELGDKATALARDYEVDPAVITQAMRFDNRRELNSFLKEHFDEVGVVEARNLIDQARALKEARRNAEAQPEVTLEQLRADRARSRTQEERSRLESIHSSAKTGMERAIEKIKGTEYPEFKFTGDPDQDEYAEKIIENASKGYSDFVKVLAAQGVKDLPPEVSEVLAETFLYGHAGSVAMASRNDHYRRAEEIKAAAVRESSMIRPQIGRSSPYSGGTGSQEPRAPRSPTETAEALLRSVLPGS